MSLEDQYTGQVPLQVARIRVYLNANPNGPGSVVKVTQDEGSGTYITKINMVVMDTNVSAGRVLYQYIKGNLAIYTAGNVWPESKLCDKFPEIQAWLLDHEVNYSATPTMFEENGDYTNMVTKQEHMQQLMAEQAVDEADSLLATLSVDSPKETAAEPYTESQPVNESSVITTVESAPSVVSGVITEYKVPLAVGGILLLLAFL